MAFQGVSRTTPPVCDGRGDQNGDHCCYVNGEPCPLLVVDDPRDIRPNARFSCGLVLDLRAQFPQFDLGRLWDRAHRHPLYEQTVSVVWGQVGMPPCGDWMGPVDPDGTIVGQCCFRGFTFAADGTVLSGPES